MVYFFCSLANFWKKEKSSHCVTAFLIARGNSGVPSFHRNMDKAIGQLFEKSNRITFEANIALRKFDDFCCHREMTSADTTSACMIDECFHIRHCQSTDAPTRSMDEPENRIITFAAFFSSHLLSPRFIPVRTRGRNRLIGLYG